MGPFPENRALFPERPARGKARRALSGAKDAKGRVLPLAEADRTILPSKVAALADAQFPTHPVDGKAGQICINENKPRRFSSLGKKAAAFFWNVAHLARPLSCQGRYPASRSSAISRRVWPQVSASRTVSRRNSGVGRFPFPIKHLPVPQLVLVTLPGQVQGRSS